MVLLTKITAVTGPISNKVTLTGGRVMHRPLVDLLGPQPSSEDDCILNPIPILILLHMMSVQQPVSHH